MKISYIIFGLSMVISAPAAASFTDTQDRFAREVEYGIDVATDESSTRFYIGGAYELTMQQSYTDGGNMRVSGRAASAYDVYMGLRLHKGFRIQGDYTHLSAKYAQFRFTGDLAMMDVLFDMRWGTDSRNPQVFVPYIGVGGGAAWLWSGDVEMGHLVNPVVSGMAGVALEVSRYFAFDFGYRFLYIFSPDINVVPGLDPMSHQVRAGARITF